MAEPGPGDSRPAGTPGLVIVGLLVGAVGFLLLADRWFDRDVPLMRAWWPFLLLIVGAARLASPAPDRRGRHRSSRSGAWLLAVGLWGVVNEAHLFDFTYQTSWPLLVIGAGAWIVLGAMQRNGGPSMRREP